MRYGFIEGQVGKYIISGGIGGPEQNVFINGSHEPQVINLANEVLQNYPGSSFFDIGSHMGAITIPLAILNPRAEMLAFEPQPLIYYQLCGNIFINNIKNITPYNFGVGNPVEEESYVFVPIYDPSDGLTGNFSIIDGKHSKNDAKEYKKVSLIKADSFGFSNLSAVKIDVEGMELEVLEGISETLERSRPAVIFELWEAQSIADKNRNDNIRELLSGKGYEFGWVYYRKAKRPYYIMAAYNKKDELIVYKHIKSTGWPE